MKTEFDILLRYYLRTFRALPIFVVAFVIATAVLALPNCGLESLVDDDRGEIFAQIILLIGAPLLVVFAWGYAFSEAKRNGGALFGIVRPDTSSQAWTGAMLITYGGPVAVITVAATANLIGAERTVLSTILVELLSGFVLAVALIFFFVATARSLFSRIALWPVAAVVVSLVAVTVILHLQQRPNPLLGTASAILAFVAFFAGLRASVGKIDASKRKHVHEIAVLGEPRTFTVLVPRSPSGDVSGRRSGRIRRALWIVFRCGEGQFFGSGLALLGVSSINMAINLSAVTLQIYLIGVYLGANVWAPMSVAMRRIGADLRARRDAFHVLAALVLASLIPAFLVVSFIGAKTSTLKIRVDFEDGDDEVEETASPWISAVCFFSENSLCLESGDGGTNVSTWREHHDARNACRKAQQELLEARVADLKHGRPNGGAFQREVECLKPGRTVGASLDPSDDYFRRQLATYFWNTYGVSDLDVVAIDEGEDKVWKITCDAEAHVRKSFAHVRIVELAAYATGAFLLLAAVFPPWRRAQRWLTRFRWIRNVAVVAFFFGISAFVFLGLTREIVDRARPGLILDDKLELVRSGWGSVLYVAQTYWWLWVALSVVACVLLYRTALRGFLMADMASDVSLRAIFKRKKAG